MGTTMIRATMEKLIDIPVAFLLVTILVFFVFIVVIGAIVYFISCGNSKGTEMTGIMRVGVKLNAWYDSDKCKGTVPLDYGTFWISMKDPDTLMGKRLDGKLDWKEKAFPRRYEVSLLLKRFLTAYEGAELGDDPSAELLKQLLDKESFCLELGKCSYKSGKKGLTVTGAYAYKKENGDKAVIYHELSDTDTAAFLNETGCAAKTICVTLDYRK